MTKETLSALGMGGSFEFVAAVLTNTWCSKVLGLHSALQAQQGVDVGTMEDRVGF